ncbi:DUF1450 domain-containing protein [Niallia sp. XMNu-256]|uniref:DUF1450 domain-containing protein n=1 Tax=Niallia sp. XMNu-256 TaxID=3082444 RepID=UPI0030D32EED
MGIFLQKLFGKRKSLKLEFCQKNLDRFFDQDILSVFDQVINERNVVTKEFECLSHCKLCTEKAYVIANGEVIHADDAGVLLERLKNLSSC